MKHCEFCSIEYDDDAMVCYRCKDYKGMVDGPIWEDNRDRAEDEYWKEERAAAAEETPDINW